VTAGEIGDQLRSMQREAPGGRGDLGGLEQAVRTLGTVGSAEELGNMSVPLADGRRVRLADVATVRDTIAERRLLALLDGKPVITCEIMRARAHDEVTAVEEVRAAIESLKQTHPRVHIEEVVNTVDFSQGEYDAAMRMLMEGTILAVLVVWLFLRDWRATIVSAVAPP
jgi:multidrug efflux pump subunit AcrB